VHDCSSTSTDLVDEVDSRAEITGIDDVFGKSYEALPQVPKPDPFESQDDNPPSGADAPSDPQGVQEVDQDPFVLDAAFEAAVEQPTKLVDDFSAELERDYSSNLRSSPQAWY
jgi:hypothetical protein